MDNAPLYRALADETRRRIILVLLKHNLCVSALARQLNISESAVSQHLKILRQAMLLRGEKRGYYMHYDIDREKLRALGHEIADMADITRSTSEDIRRACHGHFGKVTLPMAPGPEKRR